MSQVDPLGMLFRLEEIHKDRIRQINAGQKFFKTEDGVRRDVTALVHAASTQEIHSIAELKKRYLS